MIGEPPCELCAGAGEVVLFEDEVCRVVLMVEKGEQGEPRFPGFCRVIAKRHVREMTDLAPDERRRMMKIVFRVETALRELLAPDKINLASLGNVTPHVHWHVVPRWKGDARFPMPIWGEPLREPAAGAVPARDPALAGKLRDRLRARA